MKRVPSFSTRPGFPKGLQVVLVESDSKARRQAEAQLDALSYVVTACTSCADAARKIGSRSSVGFELVLVEAQTICRGASDCNLFLNSVKGLPLILMLDKSQKSDVLRGIELGAVDFLEKPLSSLKLKNIWQHVVRKMMAEETLTSFVAMDASSSPAKDEVGASVSGLSFPKTPSPAGSGAEKGSITFSTSTRSKGSEEESSNTGSADGAGDSGHQLKASTSSSNLQKQTSKGRRKVKTGKPTGAASQQPPPLAVRPAIQPLCSPAYVAGPYGPVAEGWPQVMQQSQGWSRTAGPTFTFVPTPTSTPNPGPDQGSMPFSYPRRPVLPAFCSAWQIPSQVQGPQVSEQAGQQLARSNSTPSPSQPKPVEARHSADAAFDLDSALDSEPLYLGEDPEFLDCEFGEVFGSSESQQHDVSEAAAKLQALVAPGKSTGSFPFGLRLKKSESFLNLINQQLAETRTSLAASRQ